MKISSKRSRSNGNRGEKKEENVGKKRQRRGENQEEKKQSRRDPDSESESDWSGDSGYSDTPAEEELQVQNDWALCILSDPERKTKYAALKNEGGRYVLLGRAAKRHSTTWLPIWWHKERGPKDEQVRIKCPGQGWRLFLVNTGEGWRELQNMGQALNSQFKATSLKHDQIKRAIGEDR